MEKWRSGRGGEKGQGRSGEWRSGRGGEKGDLPQPADTEVPPTIFEAENGRSPKALDQALPWQPARVEASCARAAGADGRDLREPATPTEKTNPMKRQAASRSRISKPESLRTFIAAAQLAGWSASQSQPASQPASRPEPCQMAACIKTELAGGSTVLIDYHKLMAGLLDSVMSTIVLRRAT